MVLCPCSMSTRRRLNGTGEVERAVRLGYISAVVGNAGHRRLLAPGLSFPDRLGAFCLGDGRRIRKTLGNAFPQHQNRTRTSSGDSFLGYGWGHKILKKPRERLSTLKV